MSAGRASRACVLGVSCAVVAILGACEGGGAMDAGRPTDVALARPDTHEPTPSLVERCFVPLDTTREAYAERLRGLWLAENVANWTGLLTESERRHAPFFTDADWGTEQGRWGIEGSAMQTIELNTLAPWGSDDDTDLEMIYLEAMREAGTSHLSPSQIRDAWRAHILPGIYVWVSNRAARDLFDLPTPVLPPSSSLLGANDQSLMIDAQLTTEIFGALAPGRPAHALELAHLPILTTATGYAAHAAQLYVVLYALAPVVDPSLAPPAQICCMLEAARRVLPETSKSVEVLELVLAQYDASTDHDDWERARDELARVFQSEDAAHGHRWLEWYESSVNLGTGLLALLFGDGDLVRTIEIGTLSGWDSDNGTATMGGLLGLLHGERWVRDELARAGVASLSSEYRIARTRVGFPRDVYTLDEIAALALPRVEESLAETGGSVDGDRYAATRVREEELSLDANPYVRWLAPSATRDARAAGEAVSASVVEGTVAGEVPLLAITDGLELDASGRDPLLDLRDEPRMNAGEALATRHATITGSGRVSVAVTWDTPRPLAGARFVLGPYGLGLIAVEILDETGGWTTPMPAGRAPDASGAFAFVDADFARATMARGVRLSGVPRGPDGTATLLELDGRLAP